MFTNYKHYNTLKILIGTVSQGAISRLSSVILLEIHLPRYIVKVTIHLGPPIS